MLLRSSLFLLLIKNSSKIFKFSKTVSLVLRTKIFIQPYVRTCMHAVVIRPSTEGCGTERVNVLVPYFGSLFKLLHDKACIPACCQLPVEAR